MPQLVSTHAALANPLALTGKISDMTSHGIGPQPRAKPEHNNQLYMRCADDFRFKVKLELFKSDSEFGFKYLQWIQPCWPGPTRSSQGGPLSRCRCDTLTWCRNKPQKLQCWSSWQYLYEGKENNVKLSLHGRDGGRAWKTKCGFAKDTWDGKEDFPSSFVHDERSKSCKDDLDQTHEHWRKVTVLKNKPVKFFFKKSYTIYKHKSKPSISICIWSVSVHLCPSLTDIQHHSNTNSS